MPEEQLDLDTIDLLILTGELTGDEGPCAECPQFALGHACWCLARGLLFNTGDDDEL